MDSFAGYDNEYSKPPLPENNDSTYTIEETKSIQSDAWAQSNIENVTQKKQNSDFPHQYRRIMLDDKKKRTHIAFEYSSIYPF